LKNFTDADKVPSWADHVYAKTLAYGIYVNHPNQKELRPTDSLTRAEAAVLLAKLRANASLIQKQYVGADLEKLLAVEHLNVSKKAESNEVKVTNKRNIVMQGNVLQVAFDERFKSKQHQAGDIFTFYNKEDIKTTEGTTVFPANTKFYSKVLSITNPKMVQQERKSLCSSLQSCIA
jgi:hypothetical protein